MMKDISRILLLGLLIATNTFAQSDADEELKIAAMEALISAPPSRALPLASKALKGDHSDEVKERALFVLSQIDSDEAIQLILDTARQGDGEIRLEAIRMIGIGGNDDALQSLEALYADGGEDVRDAVLEAYMIADDEEAVYRLAAGAKNEDDFEAAVDMLGVMNAKDQLRRLRDAVGVSETLIDAYALSRDVDSLLALARDDSNPEQQQQAIEALGIVGGDNVDAALVDIYRNAASEAVREAALDGMLISGHDEGVLELYRSSQDPAEKRALLEQLVMMGSDDVWNLIDLALDDGQ